MVTAKDENEIPVREMLKSVSCGTPVSVLAFGRLTDAELAVFSASPNVRTLCIVGPDASAASLTVDAAGRIVHICGTADGFVRGYRGLFTGLNRPALVYIGELQDAGITRHLIDLAVTVVRPTVAVAGRGYSFPDSTYPKAVRKAVNSAFGLPDHFFYRGNIWIRFTDRGYGPVRCWSFSRGRLGNQLYFLLQAHRMGPNHFYAAETRPWFDLFRRIGMVGRCVVDETHRDHACINSVGQHWNLGADYSEADIQAFVRDTILQSDLYETVRAESGPVERGVALHLRSDDFLKDKTWSPFARLAYVRDALARYAGSGGDMRQAYVFSDDPAEVQRTFGSLLSSSFSTVTYFPRGDAATDLLRLALHRRKILFNSTYSAWAAHIGDCIFGNDTQVIAPSVFYHLSGFTGMFRLILASARWDSVPVILQNGAVRA